MSSVALFGVRIRPRWPRTRTRRRALRALRSLPLALRAVLALGCTVAAWFAAKVTDGTLLDVGVARTLERRRIRSASLRQRQDLAAIIHLCGAATGDAYARRGFRLRRGQRCGDHDVRLYLARVDAMKRVFARLAAVG